MDDTGLKHEVVKFNNYAIGMCADCLTRVADFHLMHTTVLFVMRAHRISIIARRYTTRQKSV